MLFRSWFHHPTTGLWAIESEGPKLRIGRSSLAKVSGLIHVIAAADGNLVLVAHNGLFRYGLAGLKPWSAGASQFVEQGNPTSACSLPDGRIAIGSLTGGLAIVSADGSDVKVIDRAHGLPNQSIFQVSAGSDNTLWCAMPTHVAAIDTSQIGRAHV